MKRQAKLESWAAREAPDMLRNAILTVDAYTIWAFERYRITKQGGSFRVDTGTCEKRFHNSRNAITWCILDRHSGRPDWCIHFEQLDERQARLSQDLSTREQLVSRSQNTKFRDGVADKLSSKRSALANVVHQLDKYVDRAKYLQHQGFTNETARTRHA